MKQAHGYTSKLLLVFALASLIFSTAARAADEPSYDLAVNARNLDLCAQAGEAQLRHRVAVAAYKACIAVEPGESLSSDAFDDCVRTALRQAKPLVAALVANAHANRQLASLANGH